MNFVPKPESLNLAKIIPATNLPSIKKEEKIPIFISTRTQKTAEEIFDPRKKGVFENTVELESDEKKTLHRKVKRGLRNKLKEKKRKEKMTLLTVKGQTKFEYNQAKKAQEKVKKVIDKKNVESVKFTKSAQFFKNLQVLLCYFKIKIY